MLQGTKSCKVDLGITNPHVRDPLLQNFDWEREENEGEELDAAT